MRVMIKEPNMQTLGDILREARLVAKISQKTIAELLNIVVFVFSRKPVICIVIL